MSKSPNPLCIINLKKGFYLSGKLKLAFTKLAQQILRGEKTTGQINLVLVDARKIKELNKKFRKIDRVTDVLSFVEEVDVVGPKPKNRILGEVVVCVEQAQKQAKRYQNSQAEEFKRLLTHGILHLLGYDHTKLQDRKLMQKKEDAYAEKARAKF